MLATPSAAAIMFVIVGCGSDSTTGPSEQNAQVGGLWSYNTGQLSGGAVRCFITALPLTPDQEQPRGSRSQNGAAVPFYG